MSFRWAALGWLVLAVASASAAHAQSDACSGAIALPADWVVAPIDACPGATLARVCGAAASAACPDVSIVADEIGASLDACRADPALLAAADALYDAGTPSSLEAAARIYLRLATPLGALALFRAARSSERLGRARDAAALYARLMGDAHLAAPIHAVVVDRYASLFAAEITEPFPLARFLDATWLPVAPWAESIGLRALTMIVEMQRLDAEAAIDVVRARWPDATTYDLRRADVLEQQRRYDELAAHVLAATQRCEARGACDPVWIDRGRRIVLEHLHVCGTSAPRALAICLGAVDLGQHVLTLHSEPALALDVADAATWCAASLSRASASAPPALRSTTIAVAEQDVEGSFDPALLTRLVSSEALRTCAPARGAAIAVHVSVGLDGTLGPVTATPSGATATCLARLFTGLHVPAPEGAAHADGLVLFAPRSPAGARP